MAADNKSLGKFVLDGIPPSPRGVPQIEVTFDIDASGILKVTAKDKATGKTQNITITGAVGISDEEIERMKEEAEKHKEEDEKKAQAIESKNKADNIVAASEKAIKDAGDKLDPKIKEVVEEKIRGVREVTESGDKEKIDKAVEELSTELQKIGESMYAGGTQRAGGPEPAEGEAGESSSEGSENTGEGSKKPDDAKVEEGEVVE